jgi:dipeptidyl aminopeptidase/acylaminoacyl peptidase
MWQWMAVLALAGGGAAGARMMAEVSSSRNDYNLSEDGAGKLRVFARSEAEFRGAKIYLSERRAGRWSAPRPIAFSDPRWNDTDPWLTPDGETLYFSSDRPTAARPDKTDVDLWRARRQPGGGWSAPEHLGEVVNGAGPELGAELHGGVLTWSAAKRSGKGGLDIYRAVETDGQFSQPALIEGPFNTAASESDFTLSRDGRRAAFWRMVGNKGVLHIAERTAPGWLEPRPLPDSVNIGPFNFTPAFSADGKRLAFASTLERAGQEKGLADIYVVKLRAMPN